MCLEKTLKLLQNIIKITYSEVDFLSFCFMVYEVMLWLNYL